MTRPEPTDIVGLLAYMADRLDEALQVKAERRLYATEAAEELGFPASHFYGRPWRVPTFGLEYDRAYTIAEWRVWLERPEAERRAEWDVLPLKARSAARGLAKPDDKTARRSA